MAATTTHPEPFFESFRIVHPPTSSNYKSQHAKGRGCCSCGTILLGDLDNPGQAAPLDKGWDESPGVGRPSPRPFLRRYKTPTGTRRVCNASFKSPVPSPRVGRSDLVNKENLQREIEELKLKDLTLDQEIAQLLAEGYTVDELDAHIALLHEYNEMKDTGQMLLGKLAVIRGVTTKELYPEFGLDLSD
ncbi:DNA repair protein SWI5 homolog [Tiliqua scincoides]|uniref:DNA repair protein SWI5 homolog n=1 Tax=Tiliqua scincoides TaxID=71010 RepID=UPI0034630446